MLKELKTQHREVARLRFEGLTPPEIAERLEMNVQSVYNILRDPLCKSYMDGLHDRADDQIINVRKSLAQMQTKAITALDSILQDIEHTPRGVLRQTAVDILHMNGHKPVEKSASISANLTKDDISELFNRMSNVDPESKTISDEVQDETIEGTYTVQ